MGSILDPLWHDRGAQNSSLRHTHHTPTHNQHRETSDEKEVEEEEGPAARQKQQDGHCYVGTICGSIIGVPPS